MKLLVKMLLSSTLSFFSLSSFAELPANVRLKSIQSSGRGCASNSVKQSLMNDYQKFTLTYGEYVSKIDSQIFKNAVECEVKSHLALPQGWTFTLEGAQFEGNANLNDVVIANHKSNFYFNPSFFNESAFEFSIQSTFNRSFLESSYPDFSIELWSPCGGNAVLTIKSVLTLSAENPSNQSSMKIKSQTYQLKWRKC